MTQPAPMRRFLAALVLLAAWSGPARADGPGLAVTPYDERGHALGTPQNPFNTTGPATPAIGTPTEWSSTPLAVPSGAPLATVPAATARLGYWGFMNQSTALLTVVLDDGQGNAVTVLPAHQAPAMGDMGATFGSADYGPHQGRIRVFGPTGSTFSLRTE